MDARVMAQNKAVALARIESALDVLVKKHGFNQSAVMDVRKTYADPDLTDLRRVEGIADLVETLVEMAEDKKDPIKKVIPESIKAPKVIPASLEARLLKAAKVSPVEQGTHAGVTQRKG